MQVGILNSLYVFRVAESSKIQVVVIRKKDEIKITSPISCLFAFHSQIVVYF